MKILLLICLAFLIGCASKPKEKIEPVVKEPILIQDIEEEFPENCVKPYIGMNESHIDDTLCRVHDKSMDKIVGLKKNRYTQTSYIWYAANGKDIPLIVTCSYGKVDNVSIYFSSTNRVYWTEDGFPDFDKEYEKTPTFETDDYDVKSYDNPDDFYEDHDSDFEDYEEAEEYWEDWH